MIDRIARAELAQGWKILSVTFIGLALGSASLFIFSQGLFIKALQSAFDWSRSEAAAQGTVFAVTMALSSPLCGLLVDKFGVRAVSSVSILSLSAGFVALSQSSGNFMPFILIVAVMAFLAVGTTGISYVRLIGNWFDRARGLAIGIAMTSSGFATLILPAVLGSYIASHGWRAGYQLLAVLALVPLPLVLLIRSEHRPVDNSLRQADFGLTLREAMATGRFWLLGAAFALAGMASAGLLPHFIPLLQDAGMPLPRAGATFGIVGFAMLVARILTGWLCDHVFAPFIAVAIFVLCALGLLCFLLLGLQATVVTALGLGLAMGAEIDLVGYMSARYFGLRAYGAVIGMQYGIFALGAGCGPLLHGVLYDRFGGYSVSLVLCIILLTAAVPCVLMIGRYPEWRHNETGDARPD